MKQHLARTLCWAEDAGECQCGGPENCVHFDDWTQPVDWPKYILESLHTQGFTIAPLEPEFRSSHWAGVNRELVKLTQAIGTESQDLAHEYTDRVFRVLKANEES